MVLNELPFDAAVAALEAAGERTRLRLLVLLAEAELTVSELVAILGQWNWYLPQWLGRLLRVDASPHSESPASTAPASTQDALG